MKYIRINIITTGIMENTIYIFIYISKYATIKNRMRFKMNWISLSILLRYNIIIYNSRINDNNLNWKQF